MEKEKINEKEKEEAVVGNIEEKDIKLDNLKKKIGNKAKDILNTKDSTDTIDKKDIKSGLLMGILSYIVPPIPYFTEKKNEFVKFHSREGMNLLAVDIIFYIISIILRNIIQVNRSCFGFENCYKETPWWVNYPLDIIGIILGVIALIGVINVINGKAKELPLVNRIKIFK